MADEADRAQDRAEMLRQEAITRTLATADMTTPTGDGICVDCDEVIPPARIAATGGRALRCVFCESQHEGGRRYLDV